MHVKLYQHFTMKNRVHLIFISFSVVLLVVSPSSSFFLGNAHPVPHDLSRERAIINHGFAAFNADEKDENFVKKTSKNSIAAPIATTETNMTIKLSKSIFKKGEPIFFSVSFQLPSKTTLNLSLLIYLEPTSFLKAQLIGWPPLITLMPMTNRTLVNDASTAKNFTVECQFGPFITDLNSNGIYALNAINNGYEQHGIPSWAKYRIISLKILNNTESGSNIFLEQQLDPPLEFEVQSINENTLLSLVYADSEFWSDYGDPSLILNESLHDTYEYQDRNITFTTEWNFKFRPFITNWTTLDPLNLNDELPRLLTLPKDTIRMNSNWDLKNGTAPKNHGFDNLMGLSGKENEGEALGGLAYIDSNALVTSGGWNYIIRFTYSRDVVRRVIIHEFIHNLGFGHINESGWLMSSPIGDWKIHEDTHETIEKNKDQFDGIIFKSEPNHPSFITTFNSTLYTHQKITLTWKVNPKQLGGAIIGYELQWSPTSDFNSDVSSQLIIKQQQYTLSFKQAGTYFFRVKSINKWNQTSNWSDTIELTIKPNPSVTNTNDNNQNSLVSSFNGMETLAILVISAFVTFRKQKHYSR